MEEKGLIKKKVRIFGYLAMILGLGYNFYNSFYRYGPTRTVIIGTIVTIILSVLFIELLAYIFPKFVKNSNIIQSNKNVKNFKK